MTTTLAKLTMYANNKRTLKFTVTDEDNGDVAFDLTGMSIKWALSRQSGSSYSSTAALEKKSSVGISEIEVTNAAGGLLSVKLVAADTANLLGDFHQELEIFDAVNEPIVVAVGDVEILRNVTNT